MTRGRMVLFSARPSDVESDKPYLFRIGFCPWGATVIAVEDSR